MGTTAARNDKFRRLVFHRKQRDGKFVITQGITSLPEQTVRTIFRAIANQTEFEPENNPNRNIDDRFTPLERVVYNSISTSLDTALDNREAVRRAMFLLEIPATPAALDNRK